MDGAERPPVQRRLRIDLGDLGFAFDGGPGEAASYLDVETGEVLWVSTEVRQELERIDEEIDADLVDNEPRQAAIAAAAAGRGLPDWMVDELLEADRVEAGFGSRFIRIPPAESRAGYEDMEEFISTVGNERLQEQLWIAIRGRGAFRRFKDVLADHPTERERWFTFKDERVRGRVLAWLAKEGIEPIAAPH